MATREIDLIRVGVVVGYTLLAFGLCLGGTSAADVVFLAVTGICAFIAILLADWVNAGRQQQGDGDHDLR